jgi:hypothetical protein
MIEREVYIYIYILLSPLECPVRAAASTVSSTTLLLLSNLDNDNGDLHASSSHLARYISEWGPSDKLAHRTSTLARIDLNGLYSGQYSREEDNSDYSTDLVRSPYLSLKTVAEHVSYIVAT